MYKKTLQQKSYKKSYGDIKKVHSINFSKIQIYLITENLLSLYSLFVDKRTK